MNKKKYVIAFGAIISVFLLMGFLVSINFDFGKIVATFSQLGPRSGKASLPGAVPTPAVGSEKIGNHTYQAPRVLQDDEFAIMKSGLVTGKKKTIEIQLKSGVTYTTEIYEGQNISVMEPDGSAGYAVDDAAEIHNLSELYQDKSSIEAKVSPVVSYVLKKRNTVPVIIRFGGLKQMYVASDTWTIRKEKMDRFSALRNMIRSRIASNGRVKEDLSIINGVSANVSQAALESLRNDPNVQKIEYNGTVRGTLFESLDQIGAKNVWNNADANNVSVTGKGVRIAIVDTGVDYTHPDLGGCFGAGCKVAFGWDFVNNDADPMDDFGHGTHVASTAAGKGILNGVAPDATIYAYKVLGSSNSGSVENVILGIQRATDPNQDGDTSDHVDVGNLSLGSADGNPLDSVSSAVDASTAAGVVWAVAAGNRGWAGPGNIDSPGTAASAVTVAATCKDSQTASGECLSPIAAFSSRGPLIYNGVDYKKPDVAAPGNMICAARFGFKTDNSCGGDTIHKTMSGTSMATPHVAGALALLRQTYPKETPAQLKQRLKSTARDLGMDYNSQGAGEINLKAALPSNQQLTVNPGVWQIETDPTKKYSTFSQTFSITPWVDVATLAVAVKNPAPGITITSNKTVLNVSGRRTDTATITITVDNDAAVVGSYTVPAASFSSGSIDRGSIFASIRVKPSLIISGDNLDYGIDNPALANWTSPAAPISITNLRTDIASAITWSAIGLQSGVAVNGLPSTITVSAGKTQTFSTSLKINNALVPNGYYEGMKLKFTAGGTTAISSAKFYKAYYLDVAILGANSPGYSVFAWDYSKKYSLHATTASVTDPVRFYFLEPGKTDLIVENKYVKEDIDVSSGNARVDVNLADCTNKITWSPVNETGNPLEIAGVLYGIGKKTTGFNSGNVFSNRIPAQLFNNVSANFTAYAYAISAGSPSKIYIMGRELGNGITASAVITNTAQDFKILNIKANSNRPEGVMFPLIRAGYNNSSLQSTKMSGASALMQKIYYAGINAPGFTISQESEYYPISNPPKETDFPYVYRTPQINLHTGEAEYFPGKTLGKVDIGSGSITNGWGPEFFAAQFNNTEAGIVLGTVGCGPGYVAPFLRQDYSLQLYPAIAYLLKNSSGNVVKSGNINDRSQMNYSSLSSAPIIIASSLAADVYTFEIPKFEYYIQDQPYYASAIATIKLGQGLSDYNPPAIGKFSFFSNGQISEGFIPNAANKMELGLDPVGGTLVAQKVSYSTDGSTFTDATVTPGLPITTVDILALPDTVSKLTIKIYAADAAGNDLTYKFEVPQSNSDVVVADNAAPTAKITAPASGSTYTTAQTVNVIASASDNVAVTKVDFIDGTVLKGTDTTAPYEYAWSITAADNGTHKISAKAYDAAGNSAPSASVSVIVNIPGAGDISSPAVFLTSPANNSSYNSAQTVSIAATATDNVGVTKVEFYDGAVKLATDITSPYSYAWAIASANNGSHSLTAKAYDAANNSAISAAISVTVNISGADTIAPTVAITSPADGSTVRGEVAVRASARDNVGLTKTEIYIDGEFKMANYNNYASSSIYTWKTVYSANGNHTLLAKAYDAAGNVGTATATVTVDNGASDTTPPAVFLTSPANNSSYNSAQTVSIAATATDNVGVTKVEFYDGAVKLATDTTSPYSYAWAIASANNGSHSLTAKAYDAAGNSKVSAMVNMTVNIAAGCTSNVACDDGIYCNGAETCQAGVCAKGTAVICNDSNACTSDTCSESAKACSYVPLADNTSCASGVCCAGTCKAGAASCLGGGTVCWNGSYQNLYASTIQMKKFCYCAMGTYSYKSYQINSGSRTVWYYVNPYYNTNWSVNSLTATSAVTSMICGNGKAYPTNQTYVYPK